MKRELQEVSVGILRTVSKNRVNDRPRQFYECELPSEVERDH
jgi:hypothetical protein